MNTLNNEKGFTLIEALVAMAILTIGILALITMQTTAFKGNSKARGITTASNWAQDRIETLFNTKYELLADGTATSPDGFYTITWTVNDNILTSVDPVPVGSPPVPAPALRRIDVTVSRQDFGAQRDITFNYYRQIEL